MLLQGKTAIVTGGTRGIGFAIVEKFLAEGANVALAGSRQETADAAVQKIVQADSSLEGRVMGISPNLADPDAVASAFAEVAKVFGSVDILCNNAGVSSRTPLIDYSVDEFESVIDLNLNAAFVCSQAAARMMIDAGTKGVIINTSSMVSKYAQTSGSAYPASKFGINGLTLALARELAPQGIRVNAVAPGITHTDMVDALPEQMIQPLIASIPMGRMGEPEDVANAFAFLASDMAAYISGAVLPVDGLARS